MLAALLPGVWFLAEPSLGDGAWLGVSDRAWFLAAVAIPVAHQVLVVVAREAAWTRLGAVRSALRSGRCPGTESPAP